MNNKRISLRREAYKYFQPVLTNNTMVVAARVEEKCEEDLEKNKVYKFRVNLTELNKKEENNEDISKNNIDKPKNSSMVDDIRRQIQEELEKNQDDIVEKVEANKIQVNEADEEEIEDTVQSTEEVDDKVVEEKEDMSHETEDAEDKVAEERENMSHETENAEDKVAEKREDMSHETENAEDKVAEEKEDTSREVEDAKVKAVEETENIAKQEKPRKKLEDITTKMDLPLIPKVLENSIPFRRETPDNIKDFKVKLFLLATNAKKPVRIMVNRKKFLIGSDFEQMDCVIRNNKYISRCHAKIHYESDCYFIEDAGSMNGTYINGVKLAEGLKYKLIAGDIINLADCRFEVNIK